LKFSDQIKPTHTLKKIILFVLTLIPLYAAAQEQGIGLRFGEPFSVTFKTFLDDQISLEGMIGSAGPNSAQYYQRAFDRNRPSTNAFYVSHSTSSSISVNFRSAYHEDFTSELGIEQGYILGYAGAGLQLRSVNVDYTYTDTSISPDLLRESRTNVDFGADLFGGAEYYFDSAPISVFAEVGLFLELLDSFGHIKFQGGIGVRYLF
jgi:hypothetical protein